GLAQLAPTHPDRAGSDRACPSRARLALRVRSLHGGNPVSPVGPLARLTRVPRNLGSGGRSPPTPTETTLAQAMPLCACLPAVVLRSVPVGEGLKEVVRLTDEVRRGDGMALTDHPPLIREVGQRIPHLGFPPSLF